MSANGESHKLGTCDNCAKVGKLGFVVGGPTLEHKHSCPKEECREALEAKLWPPVVADGTQGMQRGS